MSRLWRVLIISVFIATVFTLTSVRRVAAACVIGSFTGSSGGTYAIVFGHSYTKTFDGTLVEQFIAGPADVGTFFSPPLATTDTFIVTDNSIDCGGTTRFNPGDGRLDPRPADRLAVYCNSTTLDIWGIGSDSIGHRLVKFGLADIIAAGSNGLEQTLGSNGIVTVGYYGRNQFGVSWLGGPLNGNGMADFRKTVTCSATSDTTSSVSNSTGGASGTCALSVVVQPGDTLFRIAVNHGTTVPELVRMNNLADPNHIRVGQVICLPG